MAVDEEPRAHYPLVGLATLLHLAVWLAERPGVNQGVHEAVMVESGEAPAPPP
jgi:hypothetical protein